MKKGDDQNEYKKKRCSVENKATEINCIFWLKEQENAPPIKMISVVVKLNSAVFVLTETNSLFFCSFVYSGQLVRFLGLCLFIEEIHFCALSDIADS